MPRLIPTETKVIKVHPGTLGYQIQQLVVEKHCFKAPQQPAQQKLALLFSHSNGFNKETLHPLIRRLVAGIREQVRYQHTDLCVYAWDARTHGDSARLNEGTFSETYNWFDHALDTQQVIRSLDLHTGYDGVFGIGHSFGATAMLLLEYMFPQTFTGICAIEPVLSSDILDTELRAQLPILASLKRRDTWPDRESCYKSLVHRDFWKIFDPEVMQLYVDYGLYETPDGTVKLKTPKEEEYHVFNVSSYATLTAYNSIRALRTPVQFVFASSSVYVTIDPLELPNFNREFANVNMVEGTHMVPNENPQLMVPEILALMDRALSVKKRIDSKL
ncbi:Alpha/Beta hydrolase protein [Halteromyces radiatus]|uniref:Alpha/Beta hydrolase protein n=1 Tax=Halteromyces radiatus TaxID=101107 RepID=UPI00221E652D|nr:Alpha/Beta hydrolase protein [Halteromyces radiatus]KAI8083053.1 Alpha/Beta hydrolase protein [Halteromyces radiatus]